jgi:hypothetical protein
MAFLLWMSIDTLIFYHFDVSKSGLSLINIPTAVAFCILFYYTVLARKYQISKLVPMVDKIEITLLSFSIFFLIICIIQIRNPLIALASYTVTISITVIFNLYRIKRYLKAQIPIALLNNTIQN